MSLMPGFLSASDTTTDKRFNIETLTGKVFKDSRIIKVTPAELTIMHETGVAKIAFENLSAAWREKFGYTEAKAEAYLAKQETMKKEADAKAKAANEKREREERLFIARIEAQEKKQLAAEAALFPPALAPLPGEEAPTNVPALVSEHKTAYDLVPKTTPLGAVHEPAFRTGRRSWHWSSGDGILTYDGYGYSPGYPYYGSGYGSYCPPHFHGHGSRHFSRPIIRVSW